MVKSEFELLLMCQSIGNIAESNNAYTTYLFNQLSKPLEEMTVLQLVAVDSECRRKFNQMMEVSK